MKIVIHKDPCRITHITQVYTNVFNLVRYINKNTYIAGYITDIFGKLCKTSIYLDININTYPYHPYYIFKGNLDFDKINISINQYKQLYKIDLVIRNPI